MIIIVIVCYKIQFYVSMLQRPLFFIDLFIYNYNYLYVLGYIVPHTVFTSEWYICKPDFFFFNKVI